MSPDKKDHAQAQQVLNETNKKYQKLMDKQRYVRMSATETVDVWSQLLIVDKGYGVKKRYRYHECLSKMNQEKLKRSEENGFENPFKFQFDNWGWLGHLWLENNDFRLPSWNQLKRAILNEQIVVLRDEMGSHVTKRLQFALQK